jgi:transposase
MGPTSKKYNKEFKLEAVRMVVEKGRSALSAATDLGINVKTLYGWIRAPRGYPGRAGINRYCLLRVFEI